MELELYNDKLCIPAAALIISELNPGGFISKPMYDKICRKDRELVARRGGFEHPALVDVENLPTKYRVMVYKRYPNPKAQAEAREYMNAIVNDVEAISFFRDHLVELPDVHLPEETQEQYVNNAKILNMFREKLTSGKSMRMKSTNKRINMTEFWIKRSDELKRYADVCPNSLPENPRRLADKYNDYVRDGYKSLISGRFTNQNTTKVTDQVGDWLVARYASQINRVNINQLWVEYNRVADERGWKPIKTDLTIRLYLNRPEIEPLWYGGRNGELAAKEKFNRQHRTLLPTMRDSLWYSDGTKLNYFYRNDEGKTCTCNVYEVMDVYSEVMLGYHISKSEDFEAQFMAYKMAMQTSGHKPYEIVFDNQGGHKKLDTGGFLKNLARIARNTAPYNGKSKTIESAFKRFQESCMRRDPFFTGQNITTNKIDSHANTEWVLANKANLPTLEEVKKYYRIRRDEWNNGAHPKTGRSRIEMYRSSINPNSPRIEILDMISLFWIQNDKPITYRASGLQITIKGISYAFEVLDANGQPDADFRISNVGRKFIVKYDPDDMSMLSLYEDTPSGIRFKTFAQTYIYVHRAKQDQKDDDAAFLKGQEIAGKVERLSRQDELEDRLERHGLHPQQHGYNMPQPKGISKKERERLDIGGYTKALSNAMPQELMDEADEVIAALLY